MAASRFSRLLSREGVDAARRHLAMRLDQAWALARQRVDPPHHVPWTGETRLALVAVNFSTTHYLKLMLLTLCEQDRLGLVHRLVLVDNRSLDGGLPFLRRLAAGNGRVVLVENRHLLNHARGMRSGVRALDRIDSRAPDPANLLLFCDADVIFRDVTTLGALATQAHEARAALVGELRPRGGAVPSIQASFFAVAREVQARRDIRPLVHHGSPAYWQQQSIWRAGLPVVAFPSNHGGYILHRGRTGVAAAHRHRPNHPYARVARRAPHYMGVPGGAEIWAEVEARFAELLLPEREDDLLVHLDDRLRTLGTDAVASTT